MFFEKKSDAVCKTLTPIVIVEEETNFLPIDGDEILSEIPGLTDFYTRQRHIFWPADEINIETIDVQNDFLELDETKQNIIKSILLFFNVADKIVLNNLKTVSEGVPYKTAERFFVAQAHTEVEHDKIYEKLARSYYNNDNKYVEDTRLMDKIIATASKYSNEVFNFDNYICPEFEKKTENEKNIFRAVVDKINLMNRWKNVKSLRHNIVSYFIFETVGFNTLFAFIRTFKDNNKGVRCLADTNELVLKDEKVHAEFGLYLYKNFVMNKLSEEDFKFVLEEICETEIAFMKKTIPENFIINNRDINHYIGLIKCDANDICRELDYNKLYEEEGKRDEALTVHHKPNFFERPATYLIENKPLDFKNVSNIFN